MSLDDDLAAWAATVRLTDADAEAVFRRIVLTGPAAAPSARKAGRPAAVTAFPAAAASATALSAPAGLSPSWWRDYTKGFAARMVTATRPVLVAA
jgi:hypothetical protein